MNIRPWLVRLRAFAANRRLKRATHHTAAAQEAFLRRLLSRNQASQFGREHGFASCTGVDDFRRLVPIRDYEGHRPYIERLVAGEQAVLTTEPPMMFNLTSGTTSEPKLIPVTPSLDQVQAKAMQQWLAAVARQHPEAFDGSFLGLVSPATEGWAGAIPFGSTSGRIYQRVPWVMRHRYALPYEICEIKDYEQRYFLSLRFGILHNVTLMATPNPSTLLRLAEVLSRRSAELIQAVHNGTLGIPLAGCPEALQKTLAAALRPDPRRAAELAARLQGKTGLQMTDIWPHLAVVGCWLGGSVGLQLPLLRAAFGVKTIFRDLGYLASEGRMSIPQQDFTPAGTLALANNFYEFIPEHITPSPTTPTLLAHQLEKGKRYYVLITNNAGLYRYDINDIVEVVGFSGDCPTVAFVRKGRDMTSLTGEKLHLNHVLAAVQKVQTSLAPFQLTQLRVWPNPDLRCYELALELAPSPDPTTDLHEPGLVFAEHFDQQLQRENLEYAAKRKSARLAPVQVHLMQSGWHEAWRAAAIAAGKRDIQLKWAILVPEEQAFDRAYYKTSLARRVS